MRQVNVPIGPNTTQYMQLYRAYNTIQQVAEHFCLPPNSQGNPESRGSKDKKKRT